MDFLRHEAQKLFFQNVKQGCQILQRKTLYYLRRERHEKL